MSIALTRNSWLDKVDIIFESLESNVELAQAELCQLTTSILSSLTKSSACIMDSSVNGLNQTADWLSKDPQAIGFCKDYLMGYLMPRIVRKKAKAQAKGEKPRLAFRELKKYGKRALDEMYGAKDEKHNTGSPSVREISLSDIELAPGGFPATTSDMDAMMDNLMLWDNLKPIFKDLQLSKLQIEIFFRVNIREEPISALAIEFNTNPSTLRRQQNRLLDAMKKSAERLRLKS
jgi:hypothetical protein